MCVCVYIFILDQKGLDSVPPKLDQVEEPEEDEPDFEGKVKTIVRC